ASTVTPGSTAPDVSFTTPVSWPWACAYTNAGRNTATAKTARSFVTPRIEMYSLELTRFRGCGPGAYGPDLGQSRAFWLVDWRFARLAPDFWIRCAIHERRAGRRNGNATIRR